MAPSYISGTGLRSCEAVRLNRPLRIRYGHCESIWTRVKLEDVISHMLGILRTIPRQMSQKMAATSYDIFASTNLSRMCSYIYTSPLPVLGYIGAVCVKRYKLRQERINNVRFTLYQLRDLYQQSQELFPIWRERSRTSPSLV